MKPFLALLFCACVVLPSAASAEGPRHDGQWLATLRHSVSYEQGMKQVHEKIDFAYDQGAINGALHWETIHGYYLELGRAKGCKTGAPFADGPVRACHPVSKAKPKLLSTSYNKGREQIVTMSMESLYPALVRKVLFVIYDYGYVQGMKHGLRIRHAPVHLMLVLHLLLSLLLHGDVGQAVLVLVAAGSRPILLLAEPLPILGLRVLRVQRALVADFEAFYV